MGKKNINKNKEPTPEEKVEQDLKLIKENKKKQRKESNKSDNSAKLNAENSKAKVMNNNSKANKPNKANNKPKDKAKSKPNTDKPKNKPTEKPVEKEPEEPEEELDEQENYEELLKKYEEAKKDVNDNLMPKLDKTLMKKAIKIISNEIKKRYTNNINLLSDESEEFLYINFAFSKLPVRITRRPKKIKIPHSIYDSQNFNSNICLFVKDPKSDFKELDIKFPFNLKVIDIKKLKIKYERFEQRRELLKKYDLFLCDLRIYFVLRGFLGKPFYHSNKYPIPVKLDYQNKEEVLKEITEHVEGCTVFSMTHGPIYNVKFCRSVMDEDKKLENLIEGIKETLPHILKFGVSLEE